MTKPAKRKTSPVTAAMIGTALEYYDASLYGFMAPVFAHIFFPFMSPLEGNILALLVYAGGYIARPLGAMCLGVIGDHVGRKRALTIAILGTATITTIVGFLPTYAMVGMAAPILLTICRMIQNFFQAGEYNGGAIFVMEHSNKQHGHLSGWYCALAVSGILSAAIMASLVTALPEGFWRLPFFLAAFTGIIGFIIRSNVDESPEFIAHAKDVKDCTWIDHLMPIIRQPGLSLSILATLTFYSALYTLVSISMNSLLPVATGISETVIFTINAASLFLYMAVLPLSGTLADRFGIERFMQFAILAILLFSYPLLQLIHIQTLPAIIFMKVIFALLSGWYVGPIHAYLQQKFSIGNRYFGISLLYSVATKTGAFMPPITLWIWKETEQAGWIALLLMVLGFFAILGLKNKGTFEPPEPMKIEGATT